MRKRTWIRPTPCLTLCCLCSRYYTQLSSLYEHLGIEVEDCDHSAAAFAGRGGGPDGAAPCASTARLFGFSTALGCVPWPSSLDSWCIAIECALPSWEPSCVTAASNPCTVAPTPADGAFLRSASADFCDGSASALTFGEYVARRRCSAALQDRLLFPSLAGILTCSTAHVAAYPAEVVLEFLVLAATSRTRRVAGGAAEVVRRLAAPVQDVRTRVDVVAVRRSQGAADTNVPSVPPPSIEVLFGDGHAEAYDAVVLACQANQAAALLAAADDDAWDSHRAALGSVGYEASEVVVHTDEACAPAGGPAAWESVNFCLSAPLVPGVNPPLGATGRPEATIWLNSAYKRLAASAKAFAGTGAPLLHVFQSWNLWTQPRPERVLARAVFERPIFRGPESLAGLARLASLQGEHGLFCAGSYALVGMPLLDNGVASGLRVAAALGGRLPWDACGPGGDGGTAEALDRLRSPLRLPRAEAERRVRSAGWLVAGITAATTAAALAAASALIGATLLLAARLARRASR